MKDFKVDVGVKARLYLRWRAQLPGTSEERDQYEDIPVTEALTVKLSHVDGRFRALLFDKKSGTVHAQIDDKKSYLAVRSALGRAKKILADARPKNER